MLFSVCGGWEGLAGVSFASGTTPFLHVDYMGSGWTCSTHSHAGFLRLVLSATFVFPVFPGAL